MSDVVVRPEHVTEANDRLNRAGAACAHPPGSPGWFAFVAQECGLAPEARESTETLRRTYVSLFGVAVGPLMHGSCLQGLLVGVLAHHIASREEVSA